MIHEPSARVLLLFSSRMVTRCWKPVMASWGLPGLQEQPVDLVITDVNMPNMDGITFVKKLRELEDFRFVPVLVLTTESQKSVMEEGKAAGATGWIVKPFSTDKLMAAVRRVAG
jgi:two-component system, chemotaxis family, chemotaxis protein CheY